MPVLQRKDLTLAENKLNHAFADNTRGGPGLKYREARIKIPNEVKCYLRWKDLNNTDFFARIVDLSKYGCRIICNKEDFSIVLNTRLSRAEIIIDEIVAYTGAITFVNEKSNNLEGLTIGVSLEDSGCDLDVIAAAGSQNVNLLSEIERLLSQSQTISPEFKGLTADLNMILQEIFIKLEAEEKQISQVAMSKNHKSRLEERVVNMGLSIYKPHIQEILSKFQAITKNFNFDEETVHKQYFRLNFYSLMKGTPFVERGLRKPLGYSGDYGMMVMLYEFIDQGDTLFHKFFHRFVCSEPTAVANRNRVGFLSDILIENYMKALKDGSKEFKVVSLACGPAREIYEFLKHAPLEASCPANIYLVDLEDHALSYAQVRIKEISNAEKKFSVTFLKEDVVTGFIQNKDFINNFDDSDCIISAGLFDYLTERVSTKIISRAIDKLRAGGQLLIGNISKKSPDVFAMDYFMDWRLILRDEADLISLVDEEAKSRGAKPDVISEALGLNLFLRVKK